MPPPQRGGWPCLPPPAAPPMLAPADTLDLEHCAHRSLFEGATHPWEVLPAISAFLADQADAPSERDPAEVSPLAHIDSRGVVLEEGCLVEPGATIQGPAHVGVGTRIRSGAYIRGNALIGRNCVIGNSCEIKNALIFDGCEVPHFNYVGDAVLGHRAHLGAGVILSNVRLDRGEIAVPRPRRHAHRDRPAQVQRHRGRLRRGRLQLRHQPRLHPRSPLRPLPADPLAGLPSPG